ncbi:uncharacterized protein J3R85_016886, partial [Psidium guajava]
NTANYTTVARIFTLNEDFNARQIWFS